MKPEVRHFFAALRLYSDEDAIFQLKVNEIVLSLA